MGIFFGLLLCYSKHVVCYVFSFYPLIFELYLELFFDKSSLFSYSELDIGLEMVKMYL